MLCAKCISMFQNVNKTLEGDHHETVDDLIKAAQSGCRICIHENLRREQFGTQNDDDTEKPLLQYRFIPKNCAPWDQDEENYWDIFFESRANWVMPQFTDSVYDRENSIHIHVDIADVVPVPHKYRRMLKLTKKDLEKKPWHVRRENFHTREIPSNTGDDGSMKVAENWLRECMENHKSCKQASGNTRSGWYPKRLVAVGEDGNTIRLVHSTQEHITGSYAALSHCWGKNPNFLTLTSDNHEQFRNNIPVNEVPKSFRDGISTCRRLNIKYLWIDSLCIIQSGEGSGSDWLEHATEMEMIYSNCILNLAIVHASNPDAGAFVERNPDFLQDCYLWCPLPYPNSKDKSQRGEWSFLNLSDDGSSEAESTKAWPWFRKKLTSSWEGFLAASHLLRKHLTSEELRMCVIFASNMDFRASRMSTPLASRGWVLQERLLSPRALHFQQDRIAWECQEAALSEYFPSGLPCSCEFDILFEPTFSLPPELKTEQWDPTETKLERSLGIRVRRIVQSSYWALVEEYSACELSFPAKDKLVAFSAVAKQFNPVFGTDYFVGTFREDIPEGLLWEGTSTRRQEQWRAPSWSWACVDGKVTFTLVEYRIKAGAMEVLANVEDVQVELVDPNNPYGQVTFGRLVIRGVVLPWRNEQIREGDNNSDGEEIQMFATEISSENVDDQTQSYSSGRKAGSPYNECYGQALDPSFQRLSRQESNGILFKAEAYSDSDEDGDTNRISGYHQGFYAHLNIICDGGADQDKPKLDRCFLLPINERILQNKDAELSKRGAIGAFMSWGLVLLRQDDGSYTRLGVYVSPDRCLGRDAMINGAEKQVISIV